MVKQIRMLQADADGVFRHKVKKYFSLLDDVEYLAEYETGEKIISNIKETMPNVVLVDLHLPPHGGFQVIQEIRTQWKQSDLSVLVFAFCSQPESVLTEAANLGADYFILRPVDMVVLEHRIRQLISRKHEPVKIELSLKAVQELCKHYFELMGIPPHYKGYRYLMEAIWLGSLHPSWLNAVTTKLYPAVGQRFTTTGSQVERAMRYAIDVTWEKGNLNELYRLFPYESSESKGKPTNSAFIAKMVDLINLEIGFKG